MSDAIEATSGGMIGTRDSDHYLIVKVNKKNNKIKSYYNRAKNEEWLPFDKTVIINIFNTPRIVFDNEVDAALCYVRQKYESDYDRNVYDIKILIVHYRENLAIAFNNFKNDI